MPRFADGPINLQEAPRRPTAPIASEAMGAEADRLCGATGNGGDGRHERVIATCVGTPKPRVPRLRPGSFSPEDVLEC
ncbi:transposase [Collinsella sp. AK_207A]|uniref:transposase n=1 Tax=Collinsella sp. AK_207A TaxID=2650472 RepID=UPI001D00FF39|nr:transposase [Collinsella sp. AK_207A]